MPTTFEELQTSLVQRHRGRGLSEVDAGTIVVIPAISYPPAELKKITGIAYYEERMLFTLLFLRNPDVRLVYVTCLPIDSAIIDYYLSFIPATRSEVSDRLQLVSMGDGRPLSLSQKLLESPAVLDDVGAGIDDRDNAYILPFNVTQLERRVAEHLGLPIYGPHPGDVWLGSKSGGRQVARKAGVPVFEGAEDLRSTTEIYDAITRIRAARPESEAVVIKLNNGFSGQGNAIVELSGLGPPLEQARTRFCGVGETWSSFAPKIAEEGVIVEELRRSSDLYSPSVQMRIAPGGAFEVVSTHDQILGGPDGQVYLGCRFPAHEDYRLEIQEASIRITGVLADAGVFGAFGMDFVVVPGEPPYLSEINLRAGGTTHPFLMTRLATEGRYEHATGELIADGRARAYVSTDNLKSRDYVGLAPADVIGAVRASGAGYERARRRGVSLHLLGPLTSLGKLGLTSIAGSHEEAAALQREAIAAIGVLAERR
ncbi:MAG: peptide ligase PGM1-related protein [Actinomycetota bacterium]|nr:peptide ligase PGM1-related protein [Actinomycetota bacterium]